MSTSWSHVPNVRHLLVVCAHPYDVTFALGATISAFAAAGSAIHVVCLTHGRRPDSAPGRRLVRSHELSAAAQTLGVAALTLLEHPPTSLRGANTAALTDEIAAVAGRADAVLTVDAASEATHPDQQRTFRAARRVAERFRCPLYAWVPDPEATDQRAHVMVEIDRERQRRAVAQHTTLPLDDPIRQRWSQLDPQHDHLVVVDHAAAQRRGQAATASPLTVTGERST